MRILPERYLKKVDDEEFARHPVGTGPFVFERWLRGDRIELKANPSYWQTSQPKLTRLVFKFLSPDKQLEALLSNKIDMITDLSGLDTFKVARKSGAKVVKARNFYTVSMVINSRKKPFSDLSLRQALVMAIDARALIRYGARGNAVKLNTLATPGEFGFNAHIPAAAYEPRKARRLLDQAGYKKGLRIKVLIREEIKNFGLIILAQLKKIGIEADAQVVSQKDVYEKVVVPNTNPKQPAWDGDLLITHYVNPTAHIYFPFNIFVYSKGGYSLSQDAEFDQTFLAMTTTLDRAEQEKLCLKVEEINWRKRLAFSFVQVIRSYGMRKSVSYEPHITGMLDFRTADIEVNGNTSDASTNKEAVK
ncbi:MAG: ABC transporter substrate-binding protein [Elusimicrobia bacterium]|nr:ABC transporter substrate-binding protein [Elusimicrobiota bacterium]